MSEEKPKAKINFVGYEVHIGSTYRNAKTEEQAEKIAKEWEAEEIKKWQKENSQETKIRERNDYFWMKMSYFIKDLITETRQAGKNHNEQEVNFLKRMRQRIEEEMKEAIRE